MMTALLTIAVVCVCATTVAAAGNSVTVAPSGDRTGSQDYLNLKEAIQGYEEINLQNGATYYIKNTLDMVSNRTVNATGATIRQVDKEAGILKTESNGKKGL